jgi:hypothetical protein
MRFTIQNFAFIYYVLNLVTYPAHPLNHLDLTKLKIPYLIKSTNDVSPWLYYSDEKRALILICSCPPSSQL